MKYYKPVFTVHRNVITVLRAARRSATSPYTVSFTAGYAKRYVVTLSYTNWANNAPYDLIKDHDFLSFAIGANF